MSPSAHHKDGGNAYRSAMDKVLEKNPPHIVWRKNKHGIQVAVSVHDPHTGTSIAAQAQRMRRSADRMDREEACDAAARFDRDYLERLTAFAAVVAAEEPEDETLKNAARTEI